MSVAQLALSLAAAEFGYLDNVEVERIGSFEANLLDYANNNYADFMKDLTKSGDYNDSVKEKLVEILDSFKKNSAW